MVGAEGLEPPLLSEQDPKSCVSANSTTRPGENSDSGGVASQESDEWQAFSGLTDDVDAAVFHGGAGGVKVKGVSLHGIVG